MRRQRGFTLMEVMIATALTAILTTSVLAIVRTQLVAFEMNDQVVRMQQNARAAMDFVEATVRRSCGGISAGSVGINVAGVVAQAQVPCVRLYDGATVGASSFTTGSSSSPDALEVIYATGTMTAISVPSDMTSSPTITVKDASAFAAGDFVLVGDYTNADLLRVQATTATTITFDALVTTAGLPTVSPIPAGSPVFKAATYSFFVAPSSTATYANMLMIDPNGVASANHLDFTKVQPAVEGVVDFQVAVGVDGNADGLIAESTGAPSTDEWIGNSWGETLTAAAPLPWNTTTSPPRQVRLGLILQTLNKYPGAPAPLTALEDRPFASYPTVTGGANAPRYRSIRMVVSPRAWNLAE